MIVLKNLEVLLLENCEAVKLFFIISFYYHDHIDGIITGDSL